MAQMSVKLKYGFVTGKGTEDEARHTSVTFRELTSEDVINSQLAAERVVIGENGKAVAYCSEVLMGLEMLRRQILSVGTILGRCLSNNCIPSILRIWSYSQKKRVQWMTYWRRPASGGDLMPLATALSSLIVNLSQRFDINHLQQLPLRQLLRLTDQLRKQHGKPPHH